MVRRRSGRVGGIGTTPRHGHRCESNPLNPGLKKKSSVKKKHVQHHLFSSIQYISLAMVKTCRLMVPEVHVARGRF